MLRAKPDHLQSMSYSINLHASIRAPCAPSSLKLALPIRCTASLGLAQFCRHPPHNIRELVPVPCHEGIVYGTVYAF